MHDDPASARFEEERRSEQVSDLRYATSASSKQGATSLPWKLALRELWAKAEAELEDLDLLRNEFAQNEAHFYCISCIL